MSMRKISEPAGWQGCLELEFDRRQDETILSRSLMQAPLKIQRSFYPEGKDVCHGVMLHTAGGVVGGDRLHTQVKLHPGAQVLLTTAAATKIYGSEQESQQQIEIQVAENAVLEWLPQETILFDGARYRQNVRVELEPGAIWLGWEMTRLGRSARNEKFLSGEWRSHLEVWQDSKLQWVDPQWMVGGGEMLQSLHGLEGSVVVGSFSFVGRAVSREFVAEVRAALQIPQGATPGGHLAECGGMEIGVTRLRNGMLCRYRGNSTMEARRQFIEVWELLRRDYLGRLECVPRVWQM
jgi:urease accessory protein